MALAAIISAIGAIGAGMSLSSAEQEQRAMHAQLTAYANSLAYHSNLHSLARTTKRAKCKCPSCGSREFKAHDGQMVCTYCRSPA